jgi:hypothetical protein
MSKIKVKLRFQFHLNLLILIVLGTYGTTTYCSNHPVDLGFEMSRSPVSEESSFRRQNILVIFIISELQKHTTGVCALVMFTTCAIDGYLAL